MRSANINNSPRLQISRTISYFPSSLVSFHPPSCPSFRPMPFSISSPESFITALICQLSSITRRSPSSPTEPTSSLSPSAYPVAWNLHASASPSLSTPQRFSMILSNLPKETQESIARLLTTLYFIFPLELIPALDLLDRGLVTRMVIKPERTTSAATEASVHEDYQRSPHASTTALANAPDAQIASTGEDSNREAGPEPEPPSEPQTEKSTENEVFYIQSASSQSTASTTRHRHFRRHHSGNTSTTYEVRLAAWNCTCPAFAFSAFSRALDLNPEDDMGSTYAHRSDFEAADDHDDSLGNRDHSQSQGGVDVKWRFGGSLIHTPSESESKPELEFNKGAPVPVPVPVCKHILAALLGQQIPGLFGSGVQVRTVSPDEGAGWAGGWGDGD